MSRLQSHPASGGPIALLLALATAACSTTPDTTDRMTLQGPRAADFGASTGGVGLVFEHHCGSFDCHGNTSRALRIYGLNGLRIPNEAGVTPLTGATTNDEVSSNYLSIISIEPQQMDLVVTTKGDPYSLLILKKPLLIETHKGGQVMSKGDDTETCISSWFGPKTDTAACTKAAVFPPP